MSKKRYNYYIGFMHDVSSLETTMFDIIDDIYAAGISLLTDTPGINDYVYLSNRNDFTKCVKYNKLSDLLSDYIIKCEIEDNFESYDDVLDTLLLNCVLIKQNKRIGSCEVISSDTIYHCFDQILDDIYTSDSNNWLEDVVPNENNTNLFYKTVFDCIGIFNEAIITISDGLRIYARKDGDTLFFGDSDEDDSDIKEVIPYSVAIGIGVIVRVITDSKINNINMCEIYGFYIKEDYINISSATEVRESIKITLTDDELDYEIFCDLDGNRIGNLI